LALGVQLTQAALGPPGAYAPGGSSTGSCRMTTSTHSHKAWTDKGGHVRGMPLLYELIALIVILVSVVHESRAGSN